MKICPTCGAEYPASVAFCFNDGMPLAAAQEETADDPSSVHEEATVGLFDAPEPTSMLAPTPSFPQPIAEPEPEPLPEDAADSDSEADIQFDPEDTGPVEDIEVPALGAEPEPEPEPDGVPEAAFFTPEAHHDDEPIDAPTSGSPVLLGVGLLLLAAVVGGGFWAYSQTQTVNAGPAEVKTPVPAEVAKAPAKKAPKKSTPAEPPPKEAADPVQADESEPKDAPEAVEDTPEEAEAPAQPKPAAQPEPKPKATPKPQPAPKPKAGNNQPAPKEEAPKTNMRGVPVEDKKSDPQPAGNPWGETDPPPKTTKSLREAEEEDQNPWGPIDQ